MGARHKKRRNSGKQTGKTAQQASTHAAERFLNESVALVAVAVPAVPVVNEEATMDELTVIVSISDSKAKLEAIQAKLEVEKERMMRLYRRYQDLRDGFAHDLGLYVPALKADDKRSDLNPLKNLKISAMCAYRWAKKYKKTAEDGRIQAITAVLKSAKKRYSNHEDVAPFLDRKKVPPSIAEYIEYCYEHYDEIKDEDEIKVVGNPVIEAAAA